MPKADLIKLYSQRILALAAAMPHAGRLDAPQGTARRRAPLCGSVVTVDLDLQEGRIVRFAQDVKACALGQAAASVLGAQAIGRSRTEIATARAELAAMLSAGGPTPADPFAEMEVLRAAEAYRNRHGSIMLALEATLEAMDEAEKARCA